MPTTREFRQKHGTKKPASFEAEEVTEKPSRAKRRPGREEAEPVQGHDVDDETPRKAKSKVIIEDDTVVEELNDDAAEIAADAEEVENADQFEINFRGSELLRARFPKSFELAEAVATHWLQDGNFENLPINHPLGQWAAQRGLMQAKEIEKKVLESPLFEKAAIQVLTAGMKAQGLVQKLRDRLKVGS